MSAKKVREAHILNELATTGSVSVAELARDLTVSEVTIRTTLNDLEDRGMLQRTHGGAQAITFQTVLERGARHVVAKEKIAAAAAQMVRDRDTLMLEAGTTTAMVVKGLVGRRSVQLVTNSTLAIPTARLNPDLRLIVTGGQFHHESESLIGSHTLDTIESYNARVAFVGTDGYSPERGLTTHFAEGADVIRAMHARAEETWLLADSSKFGHSGFVTVLDLADVTGVITDDDLPAQAVEILLELGLQVKRV